ncbi:MAG: cadherin domain-containing protein [Gammaproteobacteria bacterium]|nr:cadherin domain-containing protein [Gammaproteobacteria bacterium]
MFILVSMFSTTTVWAVIPPTERAALIDFYTANGNGTGWTDNTNWNNAAGTECTWFGVTCDGVDDATSTTVLELNLPGNGLTGNIPATISNLTNLTILNLADNALTGPIPISIGDITTLQSLLLKANKLNGVIPSNLALSASLTIVDIRYNALHTTDSSLVTFLVAKHAQNISTQTIDAASLLVTDTRVYDADLTWEAVTYIDHEGGYRIYLSDTPDVFIQQGPDISLKSSTFTTITGLTNCTAYNARIHSFTSAHISGPAGENNANEVESDGELSSIVPLTTYGCPAVPVIGTLTPSSPTVSEAAISGTYVATLSASDTDGDPLYFSITAGNTGSVFSVNNSGVFSVANPLDYETTTAYILSVEVSDGVNSATTDISINVINENDNSPVPSVGVITHPSEVAAAGTSVATISATDADGTSTFSYSMTGTDFTIDASTGEITVNTALDYETTASYTETVTVNDGANDGTVVITINIINENDTAPVPSVGVITHPPENGVVGTAVATVSATDADGTSTFSYSMTGTDFAIDTSTGEITVNAPLDYETTPSYTETITVNDGINDAAVDVTINILNVNDTAPTPNIGAITHPSENTAIGTAVATVSATDADGPSTFSYSMTGTDFAIDPNTGEITVSAGLDYETTPSYTETVTVNDGINDGTIDITINVLDVNDVAPAPTAGTIAHPAENAIIGTSVVTIAANDIDGPSATFSITAGNTGDAFAINASTGIITVASALDYETTTSYTLTVNVFDGLHNGTVDVIINVTNVNDVVPTPTAGTITHPAENATIGTSVVTIAANDSDGPSATFSITAGNIGTAFAIDASTGIITVASALDYETTTTYTLTVNVFDGVNNGTVDVIINVSDINDVAPAPTAGTITHPAENATISTYVVTIAANDSDGPSATFGITAGNTGNAFAIDSSTGEITVAGALDYESLTSYTLTVNVFDGLNNGTVDVIINVTNVNDTPPVPVIGSINHPLESAATGTSVVIISATDADGPSTFTYSMTGTDFMINASTGEITVNAALDFETKASYTETVTVSDGINEGTVDVTINVANVNDTAPVPVVGTISHPLESATVGTAVATISATDADGPSTFLYSITGTAFAIDTLSGAITVNAALDFETKSSYTETVTVSDGTNEGTVDITINVLDVNDVAPAPTAGSIAHPAENAILGTSVVTIAANDIDGPSATFSITAGNTGDAFAINASTGEITVAGTLDYESLTTYTLTVNVSDGVHNGTVDVITNVTNVNDVAPAPTAGTITHPAENATIGTSVVTIAANDSDGPSQSFGITNGNTGNAFAINSGTGEITVAKTLNYESVSSYTLTISVSDGTYSGELNVTINIKNVNDIAPSPAAGTISHPPENAAIGTSVVTIAANDSDGPSPTFSLISGNTGNAFSINSSTGEITIANALDYETTPNYTLTVNVSDGTLSGTVDVTIMVSNINDVAPAPAVGFITHPAENATIGTSVVTIAANDIDGPSATFSILNGNTGNAFTIDPSTGAITVNGALDYETTPKYTLRINVSDGMLSGTVDVIITIVGTNDVAPSPTAGSITDPAEATEAGTLVTTVYANDSDGPDPVFSITNGNIDNVFEIDASTGVITVAGTLDYETTPTYNLTVTVSDGTFTGTVDIPINIINENDTAPNLSVGAINPPLESAAPGTLIAVVTATDIDDPDTKFTYKMTGTTFVIDSKGVISLNATLDYETTPRITETVTVSDGLNESSIDITFNIGNTNDEAPTVALLAEVNHPLENVPIGTIVASIKATDPDGGVFFIYSIINGNEEGDFSISNKGEIFVAKELDYERTNTYTLTVEVSDGADSSTIEVTINVRDYVVNAPGGVGGGCTLKSGAAFDPVLILWILLSLVYLRRHTLFRRFST